MDRENQIKTHRLHTLNFLCSDLPPLPATASDIAAKTSAVELMIIIFISIDLSDCSGRQRGGQHFFACVMPSLREGEGYWFRRRRWKAIDSSLAATLCLHYYTSYQWIHGAQPIGCTTPKEGSMLYSDVNHRPLRRRSRLVLNESKRASPFTCFGFRSMSWL